MKRNETTADIQSSDSDFLFILDALAIAVVSAAICLASRRLLFMTAFVPLVLIARMLIVAAVARRENVNLRAEFAFAAVCTALGAFNDYNSVCIQKIYNYTVPHFFDFSTIPVWMLLFWGMILRFLSRLARWRGLDPAAAPSDEVRLGARRTQSGAVKIAAQLAIVLVTRWSIFRHFEHPLLSWLPFLIGLAVFAHLFRLTRHDLKLAGLALGGGPLIEILYIRVGHLHAYRLGWIGGAPLWIVLWWLLSILIWKDLGFRIERALLRRFR